MARMSPGWSPAASQTSWGKVRTPSRSTVRRLDLMEHDPFRLGGIGLDAHHLPPAGKGEAAGFFAAVLPDREPAAPGMEEERLGVLRELELAHGVIERSAQGFGVGGAVEVGDQVAHRAAVFPKRQGGVEAAPCRLPFVISMPKLRLPAG